MNNEKKICTITHHTVPNYGAVLQTYALQRVITKLGYNNEVLNYDCERVKENYITTFSQIKNIKQLIKFIVYPEQRKRNKKIKNFVNNNIKVSEKVYKRSELKLANSKYDFFITGSDQVWNLNIHNEDTSYMLDFVDDSNKKGSYAASFGYGDIPDKYIDITKDKLQNFKYYNVREKQGQDILKKYLNKESKLVIDPTLLLNHEEYEEIVITPKYNGEYVLIYDLTQSDEQLKFAKKIADRYDLKIIAINIHSKKMKGVIDIKDASPQEFLGYFRNARYVVTSSFHGVVFSLIFNKQFFYELNNKKINNNSRLENLAHIFNLQNRELVSNKSFEIDEVIDYNLLNKEIVEVQKKSLKVLEKMIKE